MSKKKKILKEKFYKFMSIFIIFLLLAGVLLPAIVIILDVITGQ